MYKAIKGNIREGKSKPVIKKKKKKASHPSHHPPPPQPLSLYLLLVNLLCLLQRYKYYNLTLLSEFQNHHNSVKFIDVVVTRSIEPFK
jgi:hypothetical protein